MFGAYLEGVNVKRLALTILAVFVFIFASDFLIHTVWLSDTYKSTAHLWRTDEDMKAHFAFMILGQFLIAKYFCVIFAKGYEGKGPIEGVRYGLLIALFNLGGMLINFAVTPIPASLTLNWAVACFAQSIGSGVIASLVYKR